MLRLLLAHDRGIWIDHENGESPTGIVHGNGKGLRVRSVEQDLKFTLVSSVVLQTCCGPPVG
jgi:hypothetical protein